MTDGTKRTTGTTLEDFIEAAARGITESLASQDDVSGFRFGSEIRPTIAIGYVINCPPPADLGPRASVAELLEQRAQR